MRYTLIDSTLVKHATQGCLYVRLAARVASIASSSALRGALSTHVEPPPPMFTCITPADLVAGPVGNGRLLTLLGRAITLLGRAITLR